MPSTSPKFYLIPESLLVATLDYLSKRPYAEVADAVRALGALQAAPEESK